MIIDNLKTRIKTEMVNKNSEVVALLRLVVGTAQQDNDESDVNLEKILRKMIKSNQQTIDALTDLDSANKGTPVISDKCLSFVNENNLLNSFLPKTMAPEEIVEFIQSNDLDVSTNDGKAMGLVMKTLKSVGKSVQSADVKQAIEMVNKRVE